MPNNSNSLPKGYKMLNPTQKFDPKKPTLVLTKKAVLPDPPKKIYYKVPYV
jgi:hypothetical protein